MKRALRRSLLFSLVLTGWSVLSCASAETFPYSPEYTQGAQAVLAHRYVDARSFADTLLSTDADSFEGEALLGQVHLWGEDDLGLAEVHLLRARQLFEARFPPPLSQSEPIALHQSILRSLRQTYYMREKYEESLSLVADYNALYQPGIEHLRGWPLLKLGRFREAEASVATARSQLSEEDPGQVSLLDLLGQIAYEEGHLETAREHFEEASLLEMDTADLPDPVYLTNLGETWRDSLDFETAETTWAEALGWPNPGTYSRPHDRLACLYAGQARFDEAFTQLEGSVLWRSRLYPQVSAHTRSSHLTSVGEVLLAFGDSTRSVEVLRRALHGANRQALNSGTSEALLAKRYLLYAAALDLEAQAAMERQSWSAGPERWRAWRQALTSTVAAGWSRSQAAIYLARKGRLERGLEGYGPGSMQCPWLLPEAARAIGPGPSALVAAAPSGDMRLAPYRQLLLPKPVSDEPSLPLPEADILARGELAVARGDWAEAFTLDRTVFRRLAVSLGISVEGSPELAAVLQSSPRFHAGADLRLVVAPDRSVVITDTKGQALAQCGAATDERALARAIHEALFIRSTTWSAKRLDALTTEMSRGRMASARLEALLSP